MHVSKHVMCFVCSMIPASELCLSMHLREAVYRSIQACRHAASCKHECVFQATVVASFCTLDDRYRVMMISVQLFLLALLSICYMRGGQKSIQRYANNTSLRSSPVSEWALYHMGIWASWPVGHVWNCSRAGTLVLDPVGHIIQGILLASASMWYA